MTGFFGLHSSEAFQQSVSWAGTVAAVLLFASPAPTFVKIVREKSVSQFDPLPYLLALLQCSLWDTYAVVTPNRLNPLITNLCGAGLELVWVAIFFRFSADRRKFGKQFIVVFVVWGTLTLIDTLGVPHLDWKSLKHGDSLKTDLLGLFCVALNTFMYGAPLGVARQVIKTRSVEFMPLPLSICTLACSSLWLTYALLVGDLWVLIPNVFGVILGVMQLILYSMYCGCGNANKASSVVSEEGSARNVLIPGAGEEAQSQPPAPPTNTV